MRRTLFVRPPVMTSKEWKDTERDIVRAWMSGDLAAAVRHIDGALVDDNTEVRGRALLYRGAIREDEQDLVAANRDFADGAALLPAGGYARYTAELSVAGSFEALGQSAEAANWWRAALATCDTQIERFSGGAAIRRLLLSRVQLDSSDLELARSVATKSWNILGLSGEPDLDNLLATADALRARETRQSS